MTKAQQRALLAMLQYVRTLSPDPHETWTSGLGYYTPKYELRSLGQSVADSLVDAGLFERGEALPSSVPWDFSHRFTPKGRRAAEELERSREPALAKYLHNGRRQFIRRPSRDDVQRVVSYRTECCLAYNTAHDDKAPADILAYFRVEHEWAVGVMYHAGIRRPARQPKQMVLWGSL